MRAEQEVGRHHDGGEHVVEIVRDAAGELADRFHLLLLLHPVLERALGGGLERVDDGGLAVALGLIDRRDEERRPALGLRQRRLDRRDVALAGGGLADRGLQRGPVALGHHRIDRAVVAFAQIFEGGDEARIAARDAA